MKNRFTTVDLMAVIHDLKPLVGMRVNNIYDVNSKTYLIRLQKPGEKAVILFESGMRIHKTDIDWPKSQFPSSFSMKMRKHVKEKRLEDISQLGVDRVVDMRFGDEERAVHVIVELYDRGNILLTDHEYVILNILRPRTDKDTDVKLSVKQKYPVENVRKEDSLPSRDVVAMALANAKKGDNLRRVLSPLTQLGGPLIDHALSSQGFPHNAAVHVQIDDSDENVAKIYEALGSAFEVYKQIREGQCKGYVTYKEDARADGEKIENYQEFHPFLFCQLASGLFKEFNTFSEAIDEFYSKLDEQKQNQRTLNMEKEALKKLDNVKKDQEGRVEALSNAQEKSKLVAERIIMNKELVEKALLIIRSAVASRMSWQDIEDMKQSAAKNGDPVAKSIVKLKLDSNQFVMKLHDPYDEDEPAVEANIDLALNPFQNSRRYFDDKKAANEKIQKTLASAGKAIKNAQLKTKETLDQLDQIRIRATKKRKPMWFEKFLWFVSSENYVVVAGRDAQQNELLVKRYLREGDIYMHADIRGAASIVIRNKPDRGEIPPKTLTEAAQMAVCYSNAWEAKVVANAWWVRHDQVSRTAPTGEYLASGSFMIRGKKNYMPASQLIMGFGILFRVDDEGLERHRGERKIVDCGASEVAESEATEDLEVDLEEEEEDAEKKDEVKDQEEEGEVEFPDVELNIKGLKTADSEEYSIIAVNTSSRPPKKGTQKATKEDETAQYLEKKREEERKANAANKGPTKRQKHKMDKMKKKYKDQDEEEREMRLQLLGSRGKKAAETVAEEKQVEEKVDKPKERPPKEPLKEEKEQNDGEEEKEEETQTVEDSDAILDYLTGRPVEEDNLLFAVPMVAPYQVLSSYKYKVKLTPGTGKRGKAAKSAMELFLRSKTCSPLEQAQMKLLVSDEATARNIPGKVRVSAPQLHAK